LPSWKPPERQVRSEALSPDIIQAIHSAAFRRNPTSPCSKGERRRHLARGVWETARAMFRFETWNEYWAWFCAQHPTTAAKIASKERSEEAPRAFRDNQPWNLRAKGGESCLCQSCEGLQKKMSAASRAASLLREYMESNTPNDAGVDAAAQEGGALQKINKTTPIRPDLTSIDPEKEDVGEWGRKDNQFQRAYELLKTFGVFKPDQLKAS
jgi:hypothetical protein